MFRRGNAKDLVNKLLNVLEDKKLANNISFNARKHVEENHSRGKVVDKVEVVREEIVATS